MTTKKTTMTELPRCTGPTRFAIEPHEAPTAEFPKQPSRKDGLGTMCADHWRAYVKGLREARVAAEAADEGGTVGRGEEADAEKSTSRRQRPQEDVGASSLIWPRTGPRCLRVQT